ADSAGYFFLLLLRSLLSCCLLLRGFLFRGSCRSSLSCLRCCLLFRLGFSLGKLRSGEALSVERDLGNPHCGERLPVAAQLLVLLLALVVEHEDLIATSLLDNFAYHASFRLRLADLPRFTRHRQHIAKLHLLVAAVALALDFDHIAGRYPVLLSTRANDGVHTRASVRSIRRAPAHPANPLISMCLLFSARRLRRLRAAPEGNRSHRQTEVF